MKETAFIRQNKEKWAEYEEMLREHRHDPEKLNELFIRITDDLSYARTFYPHRSVRIYLNSLAQRVFYNIYRGKGFPMRRLKRFWTDELPQLFWEERRAFLLSCCIFFLAFAIGVVSSVIDPDFARIMLGDGYVDMTLNNIKAGDPMAVYKDSGPFGMTATIAGRNLFVAFQTALLGVLASIGTVFILMYNGVMIGAFQYFFIEHGVFWESFLTIWIHGTLEVSAIIIAGASGLVAGSGLLFPGTFTRGQAFRMSIRRGLKIFFGIVPVIVLAAIFESFFTRYTETPAFVRAAFIAASLLFVLWYFAWFPRHKAQTGAFAGSSAKAELAPDHTKPVDFTAIKSAGEILSDIFSVLRRQFGKAVRVLVAATGLFTLGSFGLSNVEPAMTFPFRDVSFWLFDILKELDLFFFNESVPYLVFGQTLLLCGLSIAAFRAIAREEGAKVHGEWKAMLSMLLPAAGFVLSLKIQGIGLLCLIVYPFLALWAAVIYFENRNPVLALSRCFSLLRWGHGMMLGFFMLVLCYLMFAFIEFPVWNLALELFSWMIPRTDGAMEAYRSISTAAASMLILYFLYFLTMLGGALQYFSGREAHDAKNLYRELEQLGGKRQIRGLARE